MALSVFADKRNKPRPTDLRRELGRSRAAWEELVAWLHERFEPVTEEWTYPGAKWGWSLRVKRKKRAILYLTPRSKLFFVGFALGEKAVRIALESDPPRSLVTLIETAEKYPEGRAVRLEIRYKKDLPAVRLLAEAKMGS
jgi:hypothetical protein